MRALAILFGIILLLPGLCAVVSMGALGGGGAADGLWVLWLICFAVSFGGVMLILRGGRKRPPPRSPPE